MKRLSNTEAELKKTVAYKKKRVYAESIAKHEEQILFEYFKLFSEAHAQPAITCLKLTVKTLTLNIYHTLF